MQFILLIADSIEQVSHLERICHEIFRVDGLNLRPIRLVYLLKGAQFQRLF